jgi:hypothetical protein
MSLKNLERAVRRLEKNLPPLPDELFPFIDRLISQAESGTMSLTGEPDGPPTLSAELPTRPFSAALHALQLGPPNHCPLPTVHCSLPTVHCSLFTDLFHDLLYDDAWSPIRQALDARWPRLRWALAGQDPFYQAQGYHDCLDLLACIVWQKSTDPYTYYFTHPTAEQELALYRQYRQLPSPQRRQYRHEALEDAALYYDPTPGQRQVFLNILAELKK